MSYIGDTMSKESTLAWIINELYTFYTTREGWIAMLKATVLGVLVMLALAVV